MIYHWTLCQSHHRHFKHPINHSHSSNRCNRQNLIPAIRCRLHRFRFHLKQLNPPIWTLIYTQFKPKNFKTQMNFSNHFLCRTYKVNLINNSKDNKVVSQHRSWTISCLYSQQYHNPKNALVQAQPRAPSSPLLHRLLALLRRSDRNSHQIHWNFYYHLIVN